ncbi:MAG TPA: short-chain dehydrogenase [Bacteroidales bacterium]|nr:short-chain dehydrogenase [Bacteroidales bacterium]
MNIVVNGATRGIGKEVALILARDKSNSVLITGRNENALNQISSLPVSGKLIPCRIDISKYEDHEVKFRETVSSHFNVIDILINTAGFLVSKSFSDFTPCETRQMMETNFFGTASVIRTLFPFMIKGSHIVNITSMGGFQGSSKYRGLSYYSASKAALSCLTECLAEEFREAGIVVNCLALGSVQTEMLEEAFPGYKAPVNAMEMGELISGFALKGSKFFNGKIIPVAFSNP